MTQMVNSGAAFETLAELIEHCRDQREAASELWHPPDILWPQIDSDRLRLHMGDDGAGQVEDGKETGTPHFNTRYGRQPAPRPKKGNRPCRHFSFGWTVGLRSIAIATNRRLATGLRQRVGRRLEFGAGVGADRSCSLHLVIRRGLSRLC